MFLNLNHYNLDVYKEAKKLRKECYQLINKLPKNNIYINLKINECRKIMNFASHRIISLKIHSKKFTCEAKFTQRN